MNTEYRVLHNNLCLTNKSKARKIEKHLNELSVDGWELAALSPLTVLGTDVGFYLVVKRDRNSGQNSGLL